MGAQPSGSLFHCRLPTETTGGWTGWRDHGQSYPSYQQAAQEQESQVVEAQMLAQQQQFQWQQVQAQRPWQEAEAQQWQTQPKACLDAPRGKWNLERASRSI